MAPRRVPQAEQKILSVDLASRSYKDFGFALIESGSQTPSFPKAQELGLTGDPTADQCAEALACFCAEEKVRVLLLDGPQGWRLPSSSIEHMRLCERVLNTPGKTGDPGEAKPGTYLPYIQFSIDLYQHLRVDYGWSLLTENWRRHRNQRLLVETFPSIAWSLLGLPKLPTKSKARRADIDAWSQKLKAATGYQLPDKLSHDQLQAAAVLPAGVAIAEGRTEEVYLCGIDPIPHGKTICEGWIACPRVIDR